MDQYESTKYFTNKENLRSTIDRYGVAIIPNILKEEECQDIVSGLWDYFEHITQAWAIPLKRDKQETWREIYKLMPLHSMLFQYFNVGQSQVCWNVRQNKNIIDIYSSLWGCKSEDLLVSFDGISFNVPPEVTKRGWNQDHTWYHTDQSYTRNEFECIQSWVSGVDVNQGDATLAFLEGSNSLHKAFADHFKITEKTDWYKLSAEQEQWYKDKGCTPKRIQCPKGALVFWDSRTIHCGAEAIKGRKEPNLRAVIYVCYTPRSRATEANLKKKRIAFEELRTTNHYPHKPKLFGKSPRTYGNDVPEITVINPPIMTALGRRLAGFP